MGFNLSLIKYTLACKMFNVKVFIIFEGFIKPLLPFLQLHGLESVHQS